MIRISAWMRRFKAMDRGFGLVRGSACSGRFVGIGAVGSDLFTSGHEGTLDLNVAGVMLGIGWRFWISNLE